MKPTLNEFLGFFTGSNGKYDIQCQTWCQHDPDSVNRTAGIHFRAFGPASGIKMNVRANIYRMIAEMRMCLGNEKYQPNVMVSTQVIPAVSKLTQLDFFQTRVFSTPADLLIADKWKIEPLGKMVIGREIAPFLPDLVQRYDAGIYRDELVLEYQPGVVNLSCSGSLGNYSWTTQARNGNLEGSMVFKFALHLGQPLDDASYLVLKSHIDTVVDAKAFPRAAKLKVAKIDVV